MPQSCNICAADALRVQCGFNEVWTKLSLLLLLEGFFWLWKLLLFCLVVGILIYFFPWPIIECILFLEHGEIALHGL